MTKTSCTTPTSSRQAGAASLAAPPVSGDGLCVYQLFAGAGERFGAGGGGGAKSALSVSIDGILGYLSTLYPAWLNIASRFVSLSSLPRWLASSSSITAKTVKLLSVMTKSAIFWEKLYLLAPSLAVSNAPKLTWASTTNSGAGNASTSRQNMDCSLGVTNLFFPKAPFLSRCVRLDRTAAKTITAAMTKSGNIKDFIGSSLKEPIVKPWPFMSASERAEGPRLRGGAAREAVEVSKIPAGNHGDNLRSAQK